jgi:ATP:ADP antiporter, AAA family
MSIFSMPKTERTRFLLVTLAFMCVTSAALVARTTADTLFLSRFGPSFLSLMYVGTALVVSCVAFLYSSLIGRLPIIRLICLSIAFLMGTLLALYLGLMSSWDGAYIAAYFAADLVVHVPMMLFWSFTASLFDPRQAKRLFGLIGAGGTLACILIGFVIKPIAQQFGTAALILLVLLELACFMALILRLTRLEAHRFSDAPPKPRSTSQFRQFGNHFKTPQIRYMILMVFAANIAMTLVDYQFKAGARTHYAQSELAGFFGNFYASTSIVALIIQLFLVHRILNRGGIKLALALLPLGILVQSIATLISGQFVAIIATKVMVQIFLFTIDMAAIQMLYLSVPVASRNQARAFIDGITKPIAIAVAGVSLVAIASQIPLHMIGLGVALLSILWLVLAHINSKSYISALIDSLGSKRFDFSEETAQIQDATIATYIRDALTSAPDGDIVYLLCIAEEIPAVDWTPEYRKMISRDVSEVTVMALRHLKVHGDRSDLDTFLSFLDHPVDLVRIASIRALSSHGNALEIAVLERYLEDPVPSVRAAAIAGLLNKGDLDQLIDAGIALRDLVQSPSVTHRIAAAEGLGDITSALLHRSIVGLLNDREVAVRMAALETCRIQPDTKLIPSLIALLSDPEAGGLAADVLSCFDQDARETLVPQLIGVLAEENQDGVLLIPGILAQISDVSVLSHLLQSARSPNHLLRFESLKAYAALLKKTRSLKPNLTDMYWQIQGEMAQAEKRKKQLASFSNTAGASLLCAALEDIHQLHLKNAFGLIDTLLPGAEALPILESLIRKDSAQNNALEILDNLLPTPLRKVVLDFFEKAPEEPDPNPLSVAGHILEEDSDIWVICGALMTLLEAPEAVHNGILTKFLDHPRPEVRETAMYVLHRLGKAEILEANWAPLLEDPDASVRKLAHACLSRSSE